MREASQRGPGTGKRRTPAAPPTDPAGPADPAGPVRRLAVRKTYKLYVGGGFPRSESGRSYPVSTPEGQFVANAARASRKDARDAVRAARRAFPGWSQASPYNRGQVLYRVAEMVEARRAQFVEQVRAGEGCAPARAAAQVDAAIDRWVWYAGWADKLAQVVGSANPVTGPYFDFSVPEPTGVVAVLAPQLSSLLGLVSVLAPVVVTGNTVVLVASEARPLPAVDLAEVLATSDLPGGVVNILTGSAAELGPWLAAHRDVNACDLTGAQAALRGDLERAAAQTIKRVLRVPASEPDWTAEQPLSRMTTFLETKTVWHPVGS